VNQKKKSYSIEQGDDFHNQKSPLSLTIMQNKIPPVTLGDAEYVRCF
jgi:hypothetical protein